ncbi:hypothetical protein SAMN05216343_11938 [Oscillibacter sp. PC13]|uniref:hypothetical protein n=1 Tax=Oscillibacter sp. PC13 TaxID=1855299 RepID=UPI0008E85BC7|nr:hypothetical protein [Oscillibacter sp. PC13]SFP96311.1 hypothetical protein SAMN05216343_11938 [Oscillibacter sp. PC13]
MDKRKAAAAAAVTVVAAAGMVTGALFDSPADLLENPDPQPIVQQLTDGDNDAGVPEERRTSPVLRLRQWALTLPAAVRMLVGIPLWALGWVLLTGFSALWASALGPVAEHLAAWICLAVIVLAVFTLSVKAAFPNLPFRRILRKRTVALLLLVTLAMAAADLALPSVWNGYNITFRTLWRVGATALLVCSCGMCLGHQKKHPAPQRADRELAQEEIREEARRLADSVCIK